MTTPTSTAGTKTIDFVRLPDVELSDVLGLLNEPRNTRHMPLSGRFDEESARAWLAEKDAQWAEHGYGPWAILVDGAFAGWGGFQHEANGADFALVLTPAHWGHGAAITRAALEIAFTVLGLDAVLIALPHTRNPDRVVRRFGFVPDGDVVHDDVAFHQYRLTRNRWTSSTHGKEAS